MTFSTNNQDEVISSPLPSNNPPILKIEIAYGAEDGFGGIGSSWMNRLDWGKLSDEDWNKHLLIFDEVQHGIHALISHLGPIPPKGWSIRYWLDINDLPQSTFDAANKDNWEMRGFLGPAPEPTAEFLAGQKEQEELLKIQDPDDFTWIKVKKYQSMEGTYQEQYAALLKHHEEETKFLIEKCRELAEKAY